jgi:hypothetical protein
VHEWILYQPEPHNNYICTILKFYRRLPISARGLDDSYRRVRQLLIVAFRNTQSPSNSSGARFPRRKQWNLGARASFEKRGKCIHLRCGKAT